MVAIFVLECTNCNNLHKFEADYRIKKTKEYKLNKTVSIAGQLSNITYNEYYRLFGISGIKPFSKSIFFKYGLKVWQHTENITDNILLDNLTTCLYKDLEEVAKIKSKVMYLDKNNGIGYDIAALIWSFAYNKMSVPLIFDGRYPTKFNSMVCTVVMLHGIYKLILLRDHPSKTYTKDPEKGNKVASKNLEGIGVRECLKDLKKIRFYGMRLVPNYFLHDDDGCAGGIFEEEFPNDSILEYLDNSHGGKNYGKGVSQDWKIRLKKLFFYALNNSLEDEKLFMAILDNGLQHWLGNHKFCNVEFCKGDKKLDLSKQSHKKLYDKIVKKNDRVKARAGKYVVNLSASFIEALNCSFLVSVPKDNEFRDTYPGRADSTLSRLSTGELWLEPVLEKLETPLCEGSKLFFQGKTLEWLKERENAAKAENKKRKRETKEKTKLRNQQIGKITYYKSKKKSRPKLDPQVQVNCGKCKTGCSSNRCKCRSNNRSCNSKCGCTNCRNVIN